MALAFMLNPARRRRRAKKKRCLTKKQLAALRKGWCRARRPRSPWGSSKRPRKRRASKRARAIAGTITVAPPPEKPVFFLNNPRKKRRGRKGGRKMASKTKRRRRGSTKAKRRRAGKKAWRTRLRRYPKNKSSRGRRGYKNNPRKRRRNAWYDAAAAHRRAAKKGWRRRRRSGRKNPSGRRRRRNSMYSGRLYASNPRKRRRNARRRRRNPMAIGGTLSRITRSLTSPGALTQFAVGAAGASVSEMLGSFLASKIAGFAPATFSAGMPAQLLGAAARIAAGVAVASFLPARFQSAWVIGSGTVAVQPLVSGLLQPVLAPVGSALGLTGIAGHRGGVGGWISAAEVYGMRGMNGWLTAKQLPGVGVSGMGGRLGAAYNSYTSQPGATSAFTM